MRRIQEFLGFLCVVMIFTTPILVSSTASATAQTLVKARLSAKEVAHVLQRALKDTRIRLHNHGALKNGSYYRNDLSYAVIGKNIGGDGKKMPVTLPEISKQIWRGRYAYYINDIRSLKPRVKATAKGFKAVIKFETKGPEMVGRCTTKKFSVKFWDKKLKKVRACKALTGEKVMPGIQWLNPAIEIAFTPRRYGDSMTFYIDNIAIKGEIDSAKMCNWKLIGKRVCGKIEQFKNQVKKQVGRMLMAKLSTPKVRHAIAKNIQRRIDRKTGTSVLKIKKVSMNKGYIRIALGL